MNLALREKALRYRELAQASFDAGLLNIAADQIREAISIVDQDAKSKLLAAAIAIEQMRYHDAIEHLDHMKQIRPNLSQSPEAFRLAVKARSGLGDIEQAQLVVETWCQYYPEDPTAIQTKQHLMQVALKNNTQNIEKVDHHGSQELLEQYLRDLQMSFDDEQHQLATQCEREDHLLKLLRSARDFAAKEQLADTEFIYRVLLREYPDDASLLLEAGQIANQIGDEETALQRYEVAQDFGDADTSHRALAMIAKLHMRAGRFHSALSIWIKLARKNKRLLDAWAGAVVCGQILDRPKLVSRGTHQLRLHVSRSKRRKLLAQMWQQAADALAVKHAQNEQNTYVSNSPLDNVLSEARQTLSGLRAQHPLRADVHYHYAATCEASGKVHIAQHAIEDALYINKRYQAAKDLAKRLDNLNQQKAA